MKNIKRKKSEKGFGLIQVIIGTTLMSVVALNVGYLIVSQSKQVNYMEDRMAKAALTQELTMMLEREPACMNSLSGVTMDLTNPTNISLKDKDNNLVYNAADSSKNTFDNLKITGIAIENLDIPSVDSTGMADLVVNLTRRRSGGGATDLKPIRLKRILTLDAAGQVTSCAAESGGAFDCLDIAGYWNSTGGSKSIMVPPEATHFMVVFDRKRITWGSEDENSCISSQGSLTVHLGKTKVSGVTLTSGGLLSVNTAWPGGGHRWTYKGIVLATSSNPHRYALNCGGWSSVTELNYGSSLPAICSSRPGFSSSGNSGGIKNGLNIFKPKVD